MLLRNFNDGGNFFKRMDGYVNMNEQMSASDDHSPDAGLVA
jgi:hypothetical protein